LQETKGNKEKASKGGIKRGLRGNDFINRGKHRVPVNVAPISVRITGNEREL
jgi:hypothetical protein